MTNRKIVSTSDTLGGRYRLDGTRMPIASIREWGSREDAAQAYPHLNLTDGEWDMIRDFDWPEKGKPVIDRMTCSCGEYLNTEDRIDDDPGPATCFACGREWELTCVNRP